MLLRAFCSDTSVPNTGASGVRTMPRISPVVSTTEIVTSALLPSGRRIWPRAASATRSASASSVVTSAAVSAIAPSLPSCGGKRLTPPAVVRTKARVVVEQVVGVGPDAGSAEPERGAGERRAIVEIAGHVREDPGGRQVHRVRVGRPAQQVVGAAIGEAQAAAVDRDPLGPQVPGSDEPDGARDRDQLVEIALASANIAVEAVDAIRDRADRADERAVLVQRQAAGIGREAERRPLGADPRVDRASRRWMSKRTDRSEQGSWLIWTPNSGPPSRPTDPGSKFSWTIWLAVRVLKALPPDDRYAPVIALAIAASGAMSADRSIRH